MKTFTLTRSDYAQAFRHAAANMRAVAAHRRKARREAQRPAWLHALRRHAKAAATTLLFGLFWVLFQVFDPGPRAMGYVLCATASAGVTLALAYALGTAATRRQLDAQLSDDGCMLSPQSVAVGEAGIEQHNQGTFARLAWSLFQTRREDDTLLFLFYEPGICMVIPKAVLSAQEQALIVQRIPLMTPTQDEIRGRAP